MIKGLCKEKLLIKKLKNNNGGAIAIALIFLMIFVYIILPIFALVVEKEIVKAKAFNIRDSIEISAIATYNSLKTPDLSAAVVNMNDTKAKSIFTSYLARNLKLNADLTPKASGGIVDGKITVDSLVIYYSGFPITCPGGAIIKRPTIHVQVTIPVKPTLYKYTILSLMGVDKIDCPAHYDIEIVLDK